MIEKLKQMMELVQPPPKVEPALLMIGDRCHGWLIDDTLTVSQKMHADLVKVAEPAPAGMPTFRGMKMVLSPLLPMSAEAASFVVGRLINPPLPPLSMFQPRDWIAAPSKTEG